MDEKVNKWKVFGYVILTWVIISTIVKVAFALEPGHSVDVLTANALLWAYTVLIMGIYRTYKHKSKKKIELAYGIGGWFFIPFFVDLFGALGLLLAIVYYGYICYEWEKVKLEIK
ncbi:MAG: hypothetical protein Q7U60_00175 [Candidatus Methanoperedens sp.]|nr:hypothetical protein [Candidatus Methanoperedens sp.]